MTRAAKFKQFISRRSSRARNPHTTQLMVLGAIAVAVALALVAAAMISIGNSTSELASGPQQEVVTQEEPVADRPNDIGSSAADDDADEQASTATPTPAEPTEVAGDPTVMPTSAPTPGAENADEPSPSATAVPAPPDDSGVEPDIDTPGEDPPSPTAEPTVAEVPADDVDVEPDAGQEDFPDGSPLPDGGSHFPPPPALPAEFEPTMPEVPDLPEAPAPEPLVIYSPGVPTSEPLPTPEPVELDPNQGGLNEQSGDVFGCASGCVTRAVLTRNVRTADIGFEVETNVATTTALWILPAGPLVVNGGLAHHGVAPRALSESPGGSWSGTVSPLAFDTNYRAVLTATDEQGNYAMLTTLFTTVSEPVDDLVAVGSPCVFGCITSALVTAGPTFDRAQVHVETVDTETIEIAISQSAPGTIAGNPVLPNDVVITGLTKNGDTYDANVFDLEPDTLYHIVVIATDAEGVRQHAAGSFISMAEPPPTPPIYSVVTWVDRVHIHNDGDPVGKGEIRLHYGIQYPGDGVFDYAWGTPYQKLDEGDTVRAGGYRSVQVEADEWLPMVIVNARESDANGNDCREEVGDPLWFESTDSAPFLCANQTLAVAFLDSVTVEWVLGLPVCDSWNVPGGSPGDRCYTLRSRNASDEFVDFDALVVFRVFEA